MFKMYLSHSLLFYYSTFYWLYSDKYITKKPSVKQPCSVNVIVKPAYFYINIKRRLYLNGVVSSFKNTKTEAEKCNNAGHSSSLLTHPSMVVVTGLNAAIDPFCQSFLSLNKSGRIFVWVPVCWRHVVVSVQIKFGRNLDVACDFYQLFALCWFCGAGWLFNICYACYLFTVSRHCNWFPAFSFYGRYFKFQGICLLYIMCCYDDLGKLSWQTWYILVHTGYFCFDRLDKLSCQTWRPDISMSIQPISD